MIKDSTRQKFDLIIVWKLDRFARNRYDSARYKNTLKKNYVKVVSATENISEGSEGILLESVLEGMAEYYSADLSEKVTRGMTENALKCKFNGGTVPIGYVINKEQDLYHWSGSHTARIYYERYFHVPEWRIQHSESGPLYYPVYDHCIRIYDSADHQTAEVFQAFCKNEPGNPENSGEI